MQHVAVRPWIAAGVAVVGAGAIAVTPVAAPLPNLPVAQSRAVQLTTGGIDFLGAWEGVFTTASSNVTTLFDFFSKAPFAAPQQLIANQVGYLEDLLKGSTTLGDVFTDIQANATKAFDAATFLGGDQVTFLNPLTSFTMDINHTPLFLALTGQAVGLGIPAPAAPIPTIVDFLSSPLSGVLIGELGPFISPWVALVNSITGIITALSASTPDWTTALQDLVNIPANMVGGFLNGSTLDLSSLIPLIEHADIIPLPPGASIDSLSIAFGGLLSPGDTISTVGGATPGLGGSILNSVGIDLSGVPVFGALDAPAHEVGPLGALENLGQIIAHALGWDGVGNPLADLFGAGGSAAAEVSTPAIEAVLNSL